MSEFDNINGIYAKDATLREGIATLRNTVVSQTIKPLTVTQNGTYTASPAEGTYGYSPITVDVQEQPWQPLEDGYSNFWFELTNDTLSPWLNFSAKTEDAVIDWGDGSGEVALDTLTPTHTYTKAGKYVVKVKGVTGIDQQYVRPLDKYSAALKYVELNSDAVSILQNGFMSCAQLRNIVCHNSATTFGANAFNFCPNLINCEISGANTTLYGGVFSNCFNLLEVTLNSGIQTIGSYAFNYCMLLQQITLPSTVTAINTGAFGYCVSLGVIHVQATTPPTLGNNTFSSLPSNFIIYVPTGTGDTYKAAAGWSTYADHILEEGQTPNRAMLSRLAKAAVNDDADTEEMR